MSNVRRRIYTQDTLTAGTFENITETDLREIFAFHVKSHAKIADNKLAVTVGNYRAVASTALQANATRCQTVWSIYENKSGEFIDSRSMEGSLEVSHEKIIDLLSDFTIGDTRPDTYNLMSENPIAHLRDEYRQKLVEEIISLLEQNDFRFG